MTMHQTIEDTGTLVDRLGSIIRTMDFLQGELLLRDLGGLDEDFFNLRATAVSYSLRSINKNINNAARLMTEIPVSFEGGPTGHTVFNGTVATFVTDRVLRSIDLVGYKVVSEIVNNVLSWGQCDEERYAG